MNCQLCEAAEAAVTIIPTGEGMPQSVCSPCMARMGLALAKELLPAEEIAATIGPMFVGPEREDLHQAKPKKRRKSTQDESYNQEAPEGEAGGEAEAPPAAANE